MGSLVGAGGARAVNADVLLTSSGVSGSIQWPRARPRIKQPRKMIDGSRVFLGEDIICTFLNEEKHGFGRPFLRS